MFERRTIKKEVELEGFGIHSGKYSRIRLIPAINDGGKIVFVSGGKEITANHSNVVDIKRATTLGVDGVNVKTVEHLLSALYGLGITDLVVEVEGIEIPVLDGSAREFVSAIAEVGVEGIGKPAKILKIVKPFRYEGDNGSYIEVEPSEGEDLRLSCSISYDYPSLRWQDFEVVFDSDTYVREIAPARTFCFYEEIAHLLKSGLGRGGNYKNVVVIGPNGVMNGPPRFPDEPIRHKILDLIGDLALTGAFIVGKIRAHKNNHKLHVEFIKSLMESDSYKLL